MATLAGALSATAFTVGATEVTYGGILAAAALGASTYNTFNTPDAPEAIQPIQPVADKTAAQQAEQLDPAAIGDESEKRKRKSAKDKFKIQKDTIDTTDVGITLDNPDAVTGVQI